MKRRILTIALAAIAAVTATAQDIFSNPDNRPYLGVRASYELSIPADMTFEGTPLKADIVGSGSGFNLGVVYNIPLWRNLYFEPGASIFYNTWSINKDYAEALLGRDDISSASVRRWGVRIPLHVGYHFDFTPAISVAFFTGPEFELSFSGTENYSVGRYDISTSAFGDTGFFNRPDIKWRIGVGATFARHYYAAISGAIGLCDLMQDIDGADIDGHPTTLNAKMHANLVNITIGYNF